MSNPLKDSVGTCCTNEKNWLLASSSSFLFLVILTLTLLGTFLIPVDQMKWLSLESILTSCFNTLNLSQHVLGCEFSDAFQCLWSLCLERSLVEPSVKVHCVVSADFVQHFLLALFITFSHF